MRRGDLITLAVGSPFFPGGRDKLIALSVRPCDPSIFQ